jgi:hypothetical protein
MASMETALRIAFIIAIVAGVLQSIRVLKTSNPYAAMPEEIIACQMTDYYTHNCSSSDESVSTCNADDLQRLVVIGDVHGSAAGLIELLSAAGITTSNDLEENAHCTWKEQAGAGTILVQVGDIVDRGPEATEAWNCLRDLQSSAKNGNKVIRLIGNHELWWLEHKLHQRNPVADTRDKIIALLEVMKAEILSGDLLGAYVHRIRGKPLMFIHAGFRPKFLDQLKLQLQDSSPEGIAEYVNEALVRFTEACSSSAAAKCDYDDELFEAGPDRGGKGKQFLSHTIGGDQYMTAFKAHYEG